MDMIGLLFTFVHRDKLSLGKIVKKLLKVSRAKVNGNNYRIGKKFQLFFY
jgi:hypothetical protein